MADAAWLKQRQELLEFHTHRAATACAGSGSGAVVAALHAALSQQILPLRTVTLDVQMATSGEKLMFILWLTP
jgi:predicted acylesterase/phospholipase RssA